MSGQFGLTDGQVERLRPHFSKARGLRICIPGRQGRQRPAKHNRRLCGNRCRIENAFARLKDWKATAVQYTRCGNLFLSAIALAAAVIFWLP